MDERGQGMSYVQPRGGWEGRGRARWGHTLPEPPKPPWPPQRGKFFLWGHKDPATPPCSASCSPHTSCTLFPGHAWQLRGWCNPLQHCQTGCLLSGPQTPSVPGPRQACADLATYRYLLLRHHPRSRGSVHTEAPSVPRPHLDPSPRTTTTSSWETPTSPVLSCPDQVK